MFVKSRLKSYIFEKQTCECKRVQGITSIIFFPSSNFTPLDNGLSWSEIIATYMTNLKVKFECSSCDNEFTQKWASLVIYNNKFLKIQIWFAFT